MESKDSVRMVIGLVLISISVCGELLTVYGLLGAESSDFLRSNFLTNIFKIQTEVELPWKFRLSEE